MNNKTKTEKYRRLSIASPILALLAFVSAIIFFIIIGPIFGNYITQNYFPENFPDFYLLIFFVSFSIVFFTIPAIICGVIDFIKIKKGQYTDKGQVLDLLGVCLGGLFILIVIVFYLWGVIAPGPITNYEPEWSPDGTKISYTSEQGYVATIWIMDADGSNQKKLTYGYTHSSEWSPDGNKIFFINSTASAGANRMGIWVMDFNGNNQKHLFDIGGEYKYLAWSPDGTKIAFASLKSGNADIWVIDSDGSNQINITNSTFDDCFPSWSPDGSKIAFVSEQQGNADIWVMDADGSKKINLTNSTTGDYDPVFSPDGTKIAFVSDPESRPLTEWWSQKEGDTKVKVFSFEQQGNTDIWVIDADGSNQIRLTETEGWDGQPAWSPDGTKIIFTSYREGDAQIYVMDADGGNQIRLTK